MTNVVCFRSLPDPLGIVLWRGKLEFARRAGSQVVTNVVCFRSLPFNLGMIAPAIIRILIHCVQHHPLRIVLWYSKLEFDEGRPGIEQHCHSEPVRTLVWESPSNSGQTIVIQIVPTCRFPESFHEKLYSYPGDCHASVRYFIAMTGNSPNSNLSLCRENQTK